MAERVDFYVLNGALREQRLNVACRLTAKAYLQDLRVIIWSGEDDRRACDELLWTFNDRAFVPHQSSGDAESGDRLTPVHLVLALENVGAADMLVNLSDRLPGGLERFTRIAEIIDADPERRRLGRERFKAYREHNLAPNTHQLGDGADI